MIEPVFGPDTFDGLIPNPVVLSYYALFFVFGAHFYQRGIKTRGDWAVLTIPALTVTFWPALGLMYEVKTKWAFLASAPLQAAYAWLMCFGLIGLFRLIAARERHWVRYITGSSLELLRDLPEAGFDMVITSPPYANRYDYSRTYALELAWLGYEQDDFLALRQSMLSATVENRSKREWLKEIYGNDSGLLKDAFQMYDEQEAIHEALTILRRHIDELGNRHVIRLIEGYFLEMAVIVAELGRVLRPSGVVIMVNDNVQYHGEEIPVDMILSDFAEQSGFRCERIWTLPRGKGNSSQQMRRFGRREIRKCVYQWVRE